MGTWYGIRAVRIFDFARTMRCATVGTGTRKARAISVTVRQAPSTAMLSPSSISDISNAVRTLSVKSKPKRRGYTSGRTRAWKKAIVQVREGDSIPIFQGLEADL